MNHKLTPYVVAAVVGALLVVANRDGSVWGVIEPFVGGFTAVVAIWLYIHERKRADLAALPRRLTVRYLFAGEEVYTEHQAYLAHEGDARALAQQIAFQIAKNQKLEFDATHVSELTRGPEIDDADPGKERQVFTLHIDLPLLNKDQAEIFRAYEKNRAAAHNAAPAALPERGVRLFVCAGDAAAPAGFEVVPCPAVMTRDSVCAAALAVRARLAQVAQAQVLIKGPVALGVALGHVLQHVPCRVDFLQLDQATKELGVWWSNTHVD